MAITVDTLAAAVARSHAAISVLEQELNAADAKIGDGDTGVMLSRVIRRMAEHDLSGTTDIGEAFNGLARAAASATGSSLGTLLATGMMAMGREAKGKDNIPVEALGGLFAKALEAMTARGGAKLGDKTVIDSLDAVVQTLSRVSTPAEAAQAVSAAVEQVLDAFRQRPNRIGRARMFGDATIGIDDPGMLAFTRLTHAILGQ